MENWKQKFANLAKERNISFKKEEKDNHFPTYFWISYNLTRGDFIRSGHVRVRSWKHAFELLTSGYIED